MHGVVRISLAVLVFAAPARAAVTVVTTSEDLAAITREIAGPRIKVRALLAGDKDLIAPKRITPDMPLALQNADLLIVVGSGLEDRWLPQVINASRNALVQPGSRGYFDLSADVELLEIPPVPPLPPWATPTPQPSPTPRPNGNPHYWLDPANGRRIAQAIRGGLTTLDPSGAGDYAKRCADFDRRLAEGEERWSGALAPFKGRKLAAYDKSWSYFANRFGLQILPAERLADADNRILLVEPFVDTKAAGALASKAGGRLLVLPSSVGSLKAASDYIALFDEIVARLVAALR